jgi:hypothetical protein
MKKWATSQGFRSSVEAAHTIVLTEHDDGPSALSRKSPEFGCKAFFVLGERR